MLCFPFCNPPRADRSCPPAPLRPHGLSCPAPARYGRPACAASAEEPRPPLFRSPAQRRPGGTGFGPAPPEDMPTNALRRASAVPPDRQSAALRRACFRSRIGRPPRRPAGPAPPAQDAGTPRPRGASRTPGYNAPGCRSPAEKAPRVCADECAGHTAESKKTGSGNIVPHAWVKA